MKPMTKDTITSIIGFIFMISGGIAAFVIPTNTITLMISLVVIGVGLVFYKSELYEWMIKKIK